MTKTAKETVLKILKKDYIGTMATVSENKPHSRYMTFFNDDFTLYTATDKNSHKAEELRANPHTHILLGYEGKGFGDAYVEIEGFVEETPEEVWKEKVLDRLMKSFPYGPKNPNVVILKITPTQIRLLNKKGEAPEVIEL